MKRNFIHIVALAAVAIALIAPAAGAQGPGGSGGGFQPSPQMQAAFQKWRTWRDNHKNVVSLGQTVRGLQQIAQDPDPKIRLNKSQAKAVLAVLAKWSKKPSVTDAQARTINQQITAPLSVEQLQKLATASEHHGHGGFGGGGGGGGGPGGHPGGGFGVMPAPHDYNPLNPSTMPFERMRTRAQQQMDQLIGELKATK